ncbi:MAG TPA: response regulator [Actinomycetota bacterium]|nr:response regulator [Actinomycetota bacterium]
MSKRVLIVEDDDDIRDVISLSIQTTTDWILTAAGSGTEGLIAARSGPHDVILLDAMMPDMDGPAVFVELRADPSTSQIPVIFVTAKVQAADRQRFEDLGAAGMIQKPFDPFALADQVRAILGWEA